VVQLDQAAPVASWAFPAHPVYPARLVLAVPRARMVRVVYLARVAHLGLVDRVVSWGCRVPRVFLDRVARVALAEQAAQAVLLVLRELPD
jgi:hypothetical protein